MTIFRRFAGFGSALLLALAAICSPAPSLALSAGSRTAVLAQHIDPSAQALISAMTVAPNYVHTRAINAFIIGQKAAGIWPTVLWENGWCALHDARASRQNWKNPAQVAAAVNGPSYVVDQGYTFDGFTTYLDLPFIPSTSGLTVNSLTAGSYEGTNLQGGSSIGAGGTGSTTSFGLSIRVGSTPGTFRSNMASNNANFGAQTDSRGLTAASRTGSSTLLGYYNGAPFGTPPTFTAGALSAADVFVGGANSGGSLTNGRAGNIRGVVIASGWTDTQHATFYALAQACMTAIGAQAANDNALERQALRSAGYRLQLAA